MSNGNYCARIGYGIGYETSPNQFFIEDLKIIDPFARRRAAQVHSEEQYPALLKAVKDYGNTRILFSESQRYEGYSQGEIRALGSYATAHLLDADRLKNQRPVIAYEALKTFDLLVAGGAVSAEEEIAHLREHGVTLLPDYLDTIAPASLEAAIQM